MHGHVMDCNWIREPRGTHFGNQAKIKMGPVGMPRLQTNIR
jgi:hypothetical protein